MVLTGVRMMFIRAGKGLENGHIRNGRRPWAGGHKIWKKA